MESQLLKTLFSDIRPDEFIAMRALVKNKPARTKGLYTPDISVAEEFAEKWYSSHDVYFGTCTRNAKKPEEEYAARGFAAWADLDADSSDPVLKRKVLKQALMDIILPPSIVVDSGGNGFHLYWLIHPTSDLDALTEVNSAITTAIGSDAVGDVARILRVDGTVNHKTMPPTPVTVLKLNERRYVLSDILVAAQLDSKVANKITSGSVRGFKSRSERDWHVIAKLVKAGMTDAAIEAIFNGHVIGAKLDERGGEKYFNHTLSRVRDKTGISEGSAVASASSDFGGIYEEGDCYYMIGSHGPVLLSTFVFDPEILLHGKSEAEQDVLVGTICAAGHEWPNIPLTRGAFVRAEKLIKELPLASWQWLGSDRDVRMLLPYLMARLRSIGLPRRRATAQLGYHDGVWVGSSQTLGPEGILTGHDANVVALPTKGERPAVVYSEEQPTKVEVAEFLKLVVQVNRPEVIWPVLGWWAACPFKTRLAEIGVRFPTLNLFGTRGSGKTSLITRIIQPLSGYIEGRAYDCNTTQFVMLSLLGSTNGVPVAFSEYRRTSLRAPDRILRYLLLLYDTGHDPRGRPDQSVVDYVLDAPITIDGEDALSDPAALERIIQINMHPEDIAEQSAEFEAFQDLTMMDLGKVGSHYLISTLDAEHHWDDALSICRQAFPQSLPDRVRRNLSVVVVGMLNIEKMAASFKIRWPSMTSEFVADVLGECLSNIVNPETGRTAIIVDEFIEDMINEAAKDTAHPFAFIYEPDVNEIWFHLSSAMGWWTIRRRMQNKPALDVAAIKAQLRERMFNAATGPKVGQYVVGREARTIEARTRWCYGVDVSAAGATGLDIPTRLDVFRPVSAKRKKEEEAA